MKQVIIEKIEARICEIVNAMPEYAPKEYNKLKSLILETLGNNYEHFLTDLDNDLSEDEKVHQLILLCAPLFRMNGSTDYYVKYNNYTAYKLLMGSDNDCNNLAETLHKSRKHIAWLWDDAANRVKNNNAPITKVPPIIFFAKKTTRTKNGWLILALLILFSTFTTALRYMGVILGAIPTAALWALMIYIYNTFKKTPNYQYTLSENNDL